MDFYRDITFAAPSASLTNFPVLVRLPNDRMKKRISSPYGYDVAFRQNETNLAFDLDFYDSSTGTGAWWVQVPSLPSNGTSTIRMVYGDSSISTNQSTPATVWADYSYVFHFSDLNNWASAVGSYTATIGGSVTPDLSIVTNPLTGLGLRILLTSGYGSTKFTLSLGNYFNVTTATLSVLGTSTITPYDRWWEINTGWTAFQYKIATDAGVFTTRAGDSTELSIPFSETKGIYCYGASTNTNELGWVVNGEIEDTSSGSAGRFRWDSPQIGGTGHSVAHPSELILDEIRISTTAFKSAAWLHYEQNQVINHANYTTYGYEYHSDGTPVIDFYPWMHQPSILD